MRVRLTAFFIHFFISSLIAIITVGLVFFIWYPSPLHTAVGVTSIYTLLLVIDVAVGPLLTLLVYKPGKKTLVMDLAIIAVLQLLALGYGLYTVAEGRPAWLVFASDRFDLVRINEIDERKLDETAAEYRTPSWLGPQWVAAVSPVENESKNELMFEALFAGIGLAQRPNLYQPLAQQHTHMLQRLQPLSALEPFNPTAHIQAALKRHPTANGWLPLSANHKDMVVLMQRDSAEIVAIVDLRPWD